MPKSFPLYLTQPELDTMAQMLLTHQQVLNLTRSDDDRPIRMLTKLRQQCCDRSGAEDPYPELPHVPGLWEASEERRRG